MSGSVTVTVRQGALRGRRRKTSSGNTFFSFQGVPYAKPPLGALRFQAPESVQPWTSIRDAWKDGGMCVQYDPASKQIVGSEDCLYLNVFTPRLPRGRSEDKPLAVLVWIHGGGFISGSCSIYDPEPFMNYGVVIVLINYRIGPLGFLSLGNLKAPGNAGLKDQIMALRWVKENIDIFGGDPKNVTIFGGSAGGASVHYHLLSPLGKDLFHRAIAQSGCAFNPWAISRDPVSRAKRLALEAGCQPEEVEDLDALFSWLQNAPANELVKAVGNTLTPGDIRRGMVFTFVPCVEPDHPGAFLPDDPRALAANGKVQRVPLILGMNSHEGIGILPGSLLRMGFLPFVDLGINLKNEAAKSAALKEAEAKLLLETASELDRVMPDDLIFGRRDMRRLRQKGEKVKDFFFGGGQLSEDTLEGLVHILTDVHFALGIMKASREHSRLGVPVYLYEFAYQGRVNHMAAITACKVNGVSHSDELGYQFNIPMAQIPEEGSQDEVTRKRLALMWTNFAKNGNPTPAVNEVITTTWRPFSELESNYLRITEDLTQDVGLLKERLQFWNDLQNSE